MIATFNYTRGGSMAPAHTRKLDKAHGKIAFKAALQLESIKAVWDHVVFCNRPDLTAVHEGPWKLKQSSTLFES